MVELVKLEYKLQRTKATQIHNKESVGPAKTNLICSCKNMTMPILCVNLDESMRVIMKCNTVPVLPGMAYRYIPVNILRPVYVDTVQLTKLILKMTCSENIQPRKICFEKKRATRIIGKQSPGQNRMN